MTDVRSDTVGARLGTLAGASAVADVWFALVGDHADSVDRFSREYLSSEEAARRRAYRSREAAERYVVTRALVRIVLSEHLGTPPRDVHVERTDTGKPMIAGTTGVHFNVTHSADLILLAVSEERPVGIDVERRRDVERVRDLVGRWLTNSEQEDVARLTGGGVSPSDAFLRVWSMKEARLKALGVGISGAAGTMSRSVDLLPLDDLIDSLPPHGEGRGYVGALAFA